MWLKFLGELTETLENFEFNCANMKDVFSAIKFRYGEAESDRIFKGRFKYVLGDSVTKKLQPLRPETLLTDFGNFDTIYIVPEMVGETGFGLEAIIITALLVVAAIVPYFTMGKNREITEDPVLRSNLFGSAPIIRDQGGIVPLVFGSPYCGGVLISSGIYTTTHPFPGMIWGANL